VRLQPETPDPQAVALRWRVHLGPSLLQMEVRLKPTKPACDYGRPGLQNPTRENVMKQAASIHNLTLPMLLPGIMLSTRRFRPDQADAINEVRRNYLAAVW
jgi:hypothetical protein